MKDLCYEYTQNGVFLNSFGCVFVHKEARCTSKTEIKDGLHIIETENYHYQMI